MRWINVLVVLSMLAAIGCEKAETMTSSNGAPVMDAPKTVETASSPAEVPPHTAVLWVRGMGCPQCAYNVDLQLLKVPGVESVKVDLSMGKVTAALSPDHPPTREQLATAIKETTFTLVRIDM